MSKNTMVAFRATEQEQKALKCIADQCGLTLSQYIRKQIREEPIVVIYHPQEILKQLYGIGNNINQIARHTNVEKTVEVQEMEQIRKEVAGLRYAVTQLIGGADVLCQ